MHQVTVVDHVSAPQAPSPERLRDGLFTGAVRRLAGLVRFDGRALRLGPWALLSFGEPVPEPGGWRRPITGGLLAAGAGGSVIVEWRQGALSGRVEGYRPRLPALLYRLTQLPFHHAVTRMALLDLRGRTPAPGVPAEPIRRLAAGAIDAGLCIALAGAVQATLMSLRPYPGRIRRTGLIANPLLRPAGTVAALGATVAAYHIGFWTLGGRTPGARLTGMHLASLDGNPVSPAQAVLRLLALPLSLRDLRARHDDLAGTEVVLDERS